MSQYLGPVLDLVQIILILRLLRIHDEDHSIIHDPEDILDIFPFLSLTLQERPNTDCDQEADILGLLWSRQLRSMHRVT